MGVEINHVRELRICASRIVSGSMGLMRRLGAL